MATASRSFTRGPRRLGSSRAGVMRRPSYSSPIGSSSAFRTGETQPANSGAPVVLVAFGSANAECLRRCGNPRLSRHGMAGGSTTKIRASAVTDARLRTRPWHSSLSCTAEGVVVSKHPPLSDRVPAPSHDRRDAPAMAFAGLGCPAPRQRRRPPSWRGSAFAGHGSAGRRLRSPPDRTASAHDCTPSK